MNGMKIPQDTSISIFDTPRSQLVALFPQGADRVRLYFSYPRNSHRRLQGAKDVDELIAHAIKAGAQADWFEGAEATAPLASFPSDDTWVPHPFKDGVALIGDAAANNDPMFGQGMALTLRDVRELTSQLRSTDDWDAAGHRFAESHDYYFNTIHTYSHWFERLFYTSGREGDAMRLRVLPMFAREPDRMPDYFMSGPDGPVNEEVRRKMFAEDLLVDESPEQPQLSSESL